MKKITKPFVSIFLSKKTNKFLRIAFLLALLLTQFTTMSGIDVYAYDGDDPPATVSDGDGNTNIDHELVDPVLDIVYKLSDNFIYIAYYLVVVIFIVTAVKGGLMAQVGQFLSAPNAVSKQMMNIGGAAVILVVAFLSQDLAVSFIQSLGEHVQPPQMDSIMTQINMGR
jgi:hypothetical protein